jgi:hypothetical protein
MVPVEMEFNIGDRVRTTKYGDGVVRYCGPHKVSNAGATYARPHSQRATQHSTSYLCVCVCVCARADNTAK